MDIKGEGSLVRLDKKPRKRCRYWQIRFSIGKNPKTKHYETKTRVVHGTYSDACKEREAFRNELLGRSMLSGDKSNLSFSDYVEYFSKQRRRSGKVKESSANKELWNLRAVAPAIGKDAPIYSIQAEDIENAFMDMREGATPSGKCASGTYLNGIYASLKALFTFAHKQGDTEINPILEVERPKTDTKEKRTIKRKEAEELLQKLDPRDRLQFGVIVVICCGLRRAECTLADWGGVSLDEQRLEILDSKTPSGVRIIPLNKIVLQAMKIRYACLKEEMASLGEEIKPDTPLLANACGESVTPHYFGTWWMNHREEFGCSRTLHELRHGFSSLLGASGASPKDIQELLGHSSPDTSIDIYTHTYMEAKAKAIDDAFDGMDVCYG